MLAVVVHGLWFVLLVALFGVRDGNGRKISSSHCSLEPDLELMN